MRAHRRKNGRLRKYHYSKIQNAGDCAARTGVREIGFKFGSLPHDPGGITCMDFTEVGGGGLCAPSLSWIRVCMRIMPLCVSVEFLCLSICMYVCLSISLSFYLSLSICIYLSVCMSLFLPPSLSLSLSQHMWCRPSRPEIPSSIPGNSSL